MSDLQVHLMARIKWKKRPLNPALVKALGHFYEHLVQLIFSFSSFCFLTVGGRRIIATF